MDDGTHIKIHGDVVGEVPDDDDEDGSAMETVGVDSMLLLE
jgi:hypothetical protein